MTKAFVDECDRLGYKTQARGTCGKLAKRALQEGIPEPVVIAAAEECARRRSFRAWSNILADLQVGAPVGKQAAPWAEREDPKAPKPVRAPSKAAMEWLEREEAKAVD